MKRIRIMIDDGSDVPRMYGNVKAPGLMVRGCFPYQIVFRTLSWSRLL